ncbi:UNVERIFIED_CONTAM: hypothetical protein GTU68_051155 [Idotea baltica]|nr:hypothetical protein [Idotea baltica]
MGRPAARHRWRPRDQGTRTLRRRGRHHQQPDGTLGGDQCAGGVGSCQPHHHRDGQPICKKRCHQLDSRLEKERLEDCSEKARQECRSVAAVGCGAGAAQCDVGMGQGPCRTPRKRTR